jgi:hypothetical protein
MKLLHEPPKLHNMNRSSWGLKTLALTYQKTYKSYMSVSSFSEYIRSEGYSFKKAKKHSLYSDITYAA